MPCLPVVVTPEGIRATAKGKPTNSTSVGKYLASKFSGQLDSVTRAMADLTKSYPPEALARMLASAE